MSEKNNNPLQDPLLIIILLFLVGGGITKCSTNIWDGVAIATTSFFTLIGRALLYYAVPFAGGTVAVALIIVGLCRFGRFGRVHSLNFSNIGVGISALSAVALFVLGIPSPKMPWVYSLWAAVLFGGPILLWLRAEDFSREEDDAFEKQLVTPLNEKINALEGQLSGIEWSRDQARDELRKAKQEIDRLKEQEKAAVGKKLEETKKKGILDSEDF